MSISRFGKQAQAIVMRRHGQSRKYVRIKGFCQDIVTRDYWKKFWPSLAEEWRSSWGSLYTLGKEVGWWRTTLYLSGHAVVIALGIVLPFNYLLAWAAQYRGYEETCRPDGKFTMEGFALYSLWDISSIFQITMGFGAFSFANAKLLDTLWDVAFARGVQGILALVAYKVTTKSLTLSMEHISVPVRTFEAIALQDSTFTAFFKQVGNFLSIKGWGHKIRILWIIISTLFIVAFPSLASAMTGYAPLTKPFVQGKDGLQFPLTSYRQVIYVVHDADRLGLQSPLILTSVPKNSSAEENFLALEAPDICTQLNNMPFEMTSSGLGRISGNWTPADERCRMIWNVREYVKQYGFLGLNQTHSAFNDGVKVHNLSAPTLNVDASSFYPHYLPLEYKSIRNYTEWHMEVQPERYWQGLAADSFSLRYTLPSENSIITPDEMDRLGNCQQTATYRWGFSFLLLFILLVFFVVWILGTYALWVDAYLHSRLDIAERDMGLYRAALDISSVLQSDLDKDIDAMTPNSVLRKRIKDHKNRGRISLQPLNDTLSMKTRMMRVRAWGRTGGYSRWIPRFSLVLLVVLLLVVLFVIFTFYGWSWRMTEPIMTWILFLFGFLVLINILVLGNGKQRALCRRCSQDRDAAHHSLRSLDDTLPPNEPMISMAEISTSEHRNHEGQPQNNSRASKSAVSTTTEHKEYYP